MKIIINFELLMPALAMLITNVFFKKNSYFFTINSTTNFIKNLFFINCDFSMNFVEFLKFSAQLQLTQKLLRFLLLMAGSKPTKRVLH